MWYSQAKEFNTKAVKRLGLWQKPVQNGCAGAFPEPRAHSAPTGAGENLISAELGASRRDAHVNRQFLCGQLNRSQHRMLYEHRGELGTSGKVQENAHLYFYSIAKPEIQNTNCARLSGPFAFTQ